MKKILMLVVMLAVGALAACTSAPTATSLNTAIANLNQTNLIALQTIANGCKIVQPVLAVAGQADSQVAAAAAVNGIACSTAEVAESAASAAVAAQAPTSASSASVPPTSSAVATIPATPASATQ